MKILYYILFFFYCSGLLAQHIPYHQYTVDDGLPSNFVYGAVQDDEGYIWVYTDKGVAKFNGSSFQSFTVHDGLPINDIWNITKDRKGRLWLHCFNKALTYIEKDTIHRIFEYGKEKEKDLYPVTTRITKDGILLLNNSNEEYLYIGDSVSVISYFDKPKAALEELMLPAAITNYLSTDTLKPKTMVEYIPKGFFDIKKLPKAINVRQSYYFKHYLVYRHTDGIVCFNLKDYTIRLIPFGTSNGGIPSFINFKEVDETLQVYSNIKLQVFDADFELIDEFYFSKIDDNKRAVQGSLLDKEGNIWIATGEDGLLLITSNQQNARIIHTANIRAITATNEDLYIGTVDGDIYKQDKTFKNKILKKGDEERRDIVKSILSKENEETILFAIEQEGLFHYDLKLDTLYSLRRFLESKHNFLYEVVGKTAVDTLTREQASLWFRRNFRMLKDFAWDSFTNTIYITTISDVWKYEEQGDWIKLIKIVNKRATTLAAGTAGKVWIGHVEGLSSCSGKEYKLEGDGTGLLAAKVNTLTTDHLGNVWVGTDGFGVYGYNGETVFEVEETKKDIVKHIYLDEDGYLWVSTNQGVKQLHIEFGSEEGTKLIRHFQTKDGLPTNAANCVYIDSTYIYVGTGKGLLRMQKRVRLPNSKRLPFYMNEIKINGKAVSKKQIYTLTHRERELEMSFAALSYQSIGAIKYYYQLENTDRVEQVNTEGKIRYPSLKRGTHQFKIYAEDIDGNKSDSITFELNVLPPWWRTTWFNSLALLLTLSVIYIIYYYRIQYIKAREAERSQIQQEIAAYELQALQAQMNPHFIFNSLTTIQYFIKNNDKKSANKYLITFGDLTRAFLEASKSRYISLEQELALLEMYIDLEQMRFEEKFETQIIVEDAVDIYTTDIPSMLLQPFVENSINHGFFHKDGKGKLEIRFRANEDGGVTCTIKDDGIGREQARIIKENSIRKHKSRGTQIVDERLAVLSKMEGYHVTVDVSDVYNAKQQVAGTCVKIRIPEIMN